MGFPGCDEANQSTRHIQQVGEFLESKRKKPGFSGLRQVNVSTQEQLVSIQEKFKCFAITKLQRELFQAEKFQAGVKLYNSAYKSFLQDGQRGSNFPHHFLETAEEPEAPVITAISEVDYQEYRLQCWLYIHLLVNLRNNIAPQDFLQDIQIFYRRGFLQGGVLDRFINKNHPF